MIQFNAYIYIDKKSNRKYLEEVIKSPSSSLYLEWIDEHTGQIVINDEEAFNLKLEKLHSFLFYDYNISTSILIVPYFDQLFIKYLHKLNNEVLTAFEVFLRHIDEIETKEDATKIKEQIGKDNLNTIINYLKTNGNANACAEELFLHKNSYAYRIKKFTNDTLLEYNDINTLLFIKLILSIAN